MPVSDFIEFWKDQSLRDDLKYQLEYFGTYGLISIGIEARKQLSKCELDNFMVWIKDIYH